MSRTDSGEMFSCGWSLSDFVRHCFYSNLFHYHLKADEYYINFVKYFVCFLPSFSVMFINLLKTYFIFALPLTVLGARTYSHAQKIKLREEVREMFQHAYEGYLRYASDYDELRPLTCDGVNTWGSYSLTLIDALDTLAVMGNYSEFRRVADLIATKINFDNDINVSVFETNIRIVGGLLSAHLLSRKAGVDLEPGWPCNGPLLRLAENVAKRLLPSFDSKTGMPYGTVNLRYGVPSGETSVTCTAGVGTFIVEFGALSRLTGDPIYEEVALNAIYSLWNHRSQIGLLGNHIDVQTGRWIAQDAGIGAGVDSFFEYLVKGAAMLNRPDLLEIFHQGRSKIDKYMKRDDWYVWVGMNKGQVTLPVFQSLEAYWPGVLSLIGDIDLAMKTMYNYHTVWRQYGFLPEFYNIPGAEAGANRESYPLRPELAESAMYLYRATKSPYLLEVGEDMLRSIAHSAKTSCGYATIRNVRDHRRENRMESFFLSETTKYLYLLFDEDNFLHNNGGEGVLLDTPSGTCIIEAGGYVFNTEAHPIDPSALQCCHDVPRGDLFTNFNLADYNSDEILRKERIRHDDEIEKSKKYACPEAKSSDDSKRIDLNLSIDIEVVDDKETGFDLAKEMINSFQKIQNEDLNRRQIKTFQISDLLQAINMVNIIDEMPTVLLDFMKNVTVEPQKISVLFPPPPNSSTALHIDASKPKTIWTLYLEHHRSQANWMVIAKLGIQKFDKNQNETQAILGEIIELLDASTYPVQLLNHSEIVKTLFDAQTGYIAEMTNASKMLTFTMLFAEDTIENLNERQLEELIETKEKFASIPPPNTPPVTAIDLDLFEKLHKIVHFKKRMIDTFQKLQSLMEYSDKVPDSASSTDGGAQTYPQKPNDDLIIEEDRTTDSSHKVDTIFKQKSELQSPDSQSTNSAMFTNLVHTIIKSTLPPKSKFDEQAFLKKIRVQGLYMNQTQKYELLTCTAPRFAERFSYRYETV